jgi:hypothetical protein
VSDNTGRQSRDQQFGGSHWHSLDSVPNPCARPKQKPKQKVGALAVTGCIVRRDWKLKRKFRLKISYKEDTTITLNGMVPTGKAGLVILQANKASGATCTLKPAP